MGVVYRATQLSLGRPVALKVIAAPLSGDESIRRRFLREARLAASLQHPNIVPVHDAGEAEGITYIVMAFVEGPDLRQALAAETFTPERGVGILAQVAGALDAAHAAGLVHRDVKPANILVGSGDHAYLTDFGLTRLAAGADTLTTRGEWVGTPDYSAPEQIRGDPITAATDVYALGCLLYRVLTGGVPFPRETREARVWAHLNALPPAPSEFDSVLQPFDGVVARALAKEPAARYASAGELARAALAALVPTTAPDRPAIENGRRISSVAIVGRDRELDALRSSLSAAAAGHPRLALVGGEAGVGKTRLVKEVARHARAAGVLAFRGECLDLGDGDFPYAPIAAALRELASGPHAGVLAVLSDDARGELARAFPDLASAAPAAPGAPDAGRFAQSRMFEVLLALLRRLSADVPTLLIVEDLHWADQSTRDFVTFFVRHARAERVALVATYRADEIHRGHPLRNLLAELGRHDHVERIELDRLTHDEVDRQLCGILGEPPDRALADDVFARSQGNPFFAEELLDARRSGAGVDLPATLRDALLVRIDALSEPARETLQVVAAIGRSVDDALLSAAGGLRGRELQRALRESVAMHVLVEAGGRLEFRHALVREAVYADLLPGERRTLHQAVAEALAAAPDAANHGELARHWLAAGETEQALAASVQAGLVAADAYAFGDALAHFERALDLWPEGGAAPGDGSVDRVALLGRAAEAARLVGDFDRARDLCGQAIAAVDATAEPERAARYHERLGRYSMWDPQVALASYATALALLGERPSAQRARLLGDEALALMYLGRREESRARCEVAVAAARAAGAPAEEASARSTLGFVLAFLGRPDDGEGHLREALRIATELGRVEDIGRAHIGLAEVLRYRGRLQDALAATVEGERAARRLGVEGSFGAYFAVNAAEDLFNLGRWDEAQRRLDDVDPARLEPTGRQLRESVAGRLAVARGRPDAARAHLEAGRALSDRGLPVEQVPSVYGGLAELALWEGRAGDAQELVAAALELVGAEADALNTPVLYSLGVRAQADGAPGDANKLLEQLDALISGGPSCPPQAAAHRALCVAELTRARAQPAPDAWAEAVAAWDALAEPYPGAYARYRQAEAGAGDDVLRAAHATAATLEAAFLRREIEALAVRTGVELGPPTVTR